MDIQIVLVGHKSDKVDIRTVTVREGELVMCLCVCVRAHVCDTYITWNRRCTTPNRDWKWRHTPEIGLFQMLRVASIICIVY